MHSEFILVHPRILGCNHLRAAVRLCHWILKSDTCAVEQSTEAIVSNYTSAKFDVVTCKNEVNRKQALQWVLSYWKFCMTLLILDGHALPILG